MSIKGNITKALEQFQKDLQDDPDYKAFKENARIISYDESQTREKQGDMMIKVMSNKTVITYFNLPDVNTKISRRLNDQIFSK